MPEEKWEEKYPPRALTRGEIKLLRKEGIEIVKLVPSDADASIDRVMELVYGEKLDQIDKEPNLATLELFEVIITQTYGGPDAEKNSLTPGTGTATAGRSAAGRAGKNAAKRVRKSRRK